MGVVSKRRLSDRVAASVDELLEAMTDDYSQDDVKTVYLAYQFSEKAHEGQIRRSGEPYILHPLGVASILVDLRLDMATVVTGLLHDTVEDTDVTLEDIEESFGEVVVALVDGVTKISQIRFRNTHEKQGENIRKMIVAMSKDVRVVLVKLADRLHNMRTLNHMPYRKQGAIARETLDIYAPLASRLGISSLKVELEDLGFRYSIPDRYYELAQKVDKKRKDREKYIEEVQRFLSHELGQRTKFKFEVQGRPKHLYSIFKKMQVRNVDYDQVYDLLAFRICTESLSECYEVLGIVHSLWKPIPGRFKDFIAMAKANNYQSLHTTVVGPGGERIEIQIRTHEMHRVAEWGIAAHWSYKEQSLGGSFPGKEAIDKFHWLHEWVGLHQQTNSSDEFLENIKTDLMESEVYVFTPKGDVKEFPEGATSIDFAYSIHTDIGHSVVAARVNGKMVSLRYILQNGDTVDIITSKNQTPSKDWLKYCVTSRAKSKIRNHVKAEQRERARSLGQELLERTFRKHDLSMQKRGPLYDKLLKDLGCHNIDELYVRVGYGKTTPQHVIEILIPDRKEDKDQREEENSSFIQKAFKVATDRKKKSSSLIRVSGMDDILVHYAKCCNPIPGDPVMGLITRGRGVTIHRSDCERAYELDQDRRIDVEWSGGRSNVGRAVKVRVVSHDIPGLLKSMTETFSASGINIHNAQIRTTRDKKAICLFDVDVWDTAHLSEVMQALQKIKGIISVSRSNVLGRHWE